MATKNFSPTRYWNTFGPHEPALWLEPGDMLITTTLDAHGFGPDGAELSHRPNPLTGPFAIRGAQPGDAIKLRLLRLTPNRPHGFSYRNLRGNIVPPAIVPFLPPREEMRWQIDLEAGVTRPETPPAALPDLAIPIRPVLGCIGVAPDLGQSITSYTCGSFGGNINSVSITEAVTLYLPVFVEGALLFIGDGHAVQSHGEIAGTGVEVSMEVALEVDLLPKEKIVMPRGENAIRRFTIGIDRTLETAMQQSVAEMLSWLQDDPGLSVDEACLLLGQAACFEVGNVVSPSYSMVCQVDRDLLKGG